MDGEGCYCRVGQILRQGNRGEPDGCGSALTGWGDIQQATFSEPGMKEACDQHDWCYTDCSKTHKQCDDEWYNAADQVCWDLYWNPLTSAVAAWDWLFGLNAGKGQCHAKVKAAYDYMSSYSAWMSSIGDSCSCDDSGKTYESIYKGCFKDDSARDFKVFIGRMGLSSPKRTCMNRCINYKYFSLQDGGNSKGPECFCSNDIKSNPGRYPQVADKECEVDRLGGGTLYGGAWRNAVYEIPYGVNGEQYCESDDMMNNEVACKSSSCCHWNTWEEGEASNYGKGRCWSSIGQDICSDTTDLNLVEDGEGYCQTYRELDRTSSAELCAVQARFNMHCNLENLMISYGKGVRAERCLCGTSENCDYTGTSLGEDGYTTYKVTDSDNAA